MNNMPHIFSYLCWSLFENMLWAACKDTERGFSRRVCGLACFVRCFTLSFHTHKTPWTWEKTNYSFRRRCPGAFLSLSRPPGYITCVPQGWLWHGSCHWWGPLRPELLLCTGWPSLFDSLSPGAWSYELRMGPHPAPLTLNSKPSYPLTLLSPQSWEQACRP